MPSAIGTYDRGNSDLDIRHRVAFSANYELPFGKELKGIARKALSNWQINGIYVWVTGLPFTITNPNYPQANLGPSITADRPDVTGSAVLSHPTIQEWFNTSVFALQPYGTLGNVGRKYPLWASAETPRSFAFPPDPAERAGPAAIARRVVQISPIRRVSPRLIPA